MSIATKKAFNYSYKRAVFPSSENCCSILIITDRKCRPPIVSISCVRVISSLNVKLLRNWRVLIGRNCSTICVCYAVLVASW